MDEALNDGKKPTWSQEISEVMTLKCTLRLNTGIAQGIIYHMWFCFSHVSFFTCGFGMTKKTNSWLPVYKMVKIAIVQVR